MDLLWTCWGLCRICTYRVRERVVKGDIEAHIHTHTRTHTHTHTHTHTPTHTHTHSLYLSPKPNSTTIYLLWFIDMQISPPSRLLLKRFITSYDPPPPPPVYPSLTTLKSCVVDAV